MDSNVIEKMQLGKNDGLNPTIDIIKITPVSPFRKRLAVVEQFKSNTQIIHRARLSEQLGTLKIGFIQKAFQDALLSKEEQNQNKMPNYDYKLSFDTATQNKQKTDQIKQKNEEDEIIEKQPNQQLQKKSKFHDNNNSADIDLDIENEDNNSIDLSKSIIDSENQSDEEVDQVSLQIIENKQENQQTADQDKQQNKVSFANVVNKIREANRRYQMRYNLINKLGIGKQNEDKFERFLTKNFTKLQRQETVIVKEDETEETKNNEETNQTYKPVSSSKLLVRQHSFDKVRVEKYEKKDYYEELLNKQDVNISNMEDGWMVINILKKPKRTRNEKLFLKRSLQNINLFQRHKDAVFKNSQTNEKLYESLGYKFHKRNEVIFNIGDDGDTYYIVLRGSVVLLLPKSNEDAEILEKESDIRRQNRKRKISLKDTKFFSRAISRGSNSVNNSPSNKNKRFFSQNQEPKKEIKNLVEIKDNNLPLVFQLTKSSLLEKKQVPENQTVQQIKPLTEIHSSFFQNNKKSQIQIQSPAHQQEPQNQQMNQSQVMDSPSKKSQQDIQTPQSLQVQKETQSQQNDKISFLDIARFLKDKESDFNFHITKQFPHMSQIKIFGPGEAFGEIALLTKARRTGTMVCKDDTHLMTLRKDGFDKIMGYYHNVIISERVKFFRQFEFMKQIPESKLMVLLHETKIEHFTRNQVIYAENEPLTFLYFIKEGEFKITEKCLINPPQFQNIPQYMKKQDQIHNQTEQDVFQKFSMKAYNELNKTKRLVVYQQNNDSFFGDLEIVEKQTYHRFQKAICESQESTVYCVKRDILLQFLRRFGGVKDLIKESNDKRAYQKKLIEEFQTKKCDKILRQSQIKHEREKRKQQIKDSILINPNKRQSTIDQSLQTVTVGENRSVSLNEEQPQNQQQQETFSKRFSLITMKRNSMIQNEENNKSYQKLLKQNIQKLNVQQQKEVMKSCVGSSSIDDAIMKAFLNPGVDWKNPCYRSLDSQKYSQNLLNKKLELIQNKQNEKQNEKQHEKSSFSGMWEKYKNSSDLQNSTIYTTTDNTNKNFKKPQLDIFNIQDYTQTITKGTPMSNQSKIHGMTQSLNTSMINYMDNTLFPLSNQVSPSQTMYFQRDRKKAKSTQYYLNNQDKENQNAQQSHNDSIIELNTPQDKLFKILNNRHSSQPSLGRDQKQNQQMSSTQTSTFQRTQRSFRTTIRKESPPQIQQIGNKSTYNSSFYVNQSNNSITNNQISRTNYNSFYKPESIRIPFNKIDQNEYSQNITTNHLQDTLSQFKTSKQIRQEVQTSIQIKKTILKQFIKEKNESNPLNNNQLDLLYSDPVEAKALQKAVLAKLIQAKKTTIVQQKQKSFNPIHIDIIQKLNINS